MKRLLAFLLPCLLALSASAQSDINVSINYTNAANTYASGQATTVPNMVANCVTQTNASFASQGIGIRIVAFAAPAYSAGPSDTASMDTQAQWARNSIPSLTTRAQFGASMALVISAPGINVQGAIPAVPPEAAKDAVGAVNVANLCTQLESAISRNLGASLDRSVTVRQRAYPYQGANICFHTRDGAASDTSSVIPYLPFWATPSTGGTNAATAPTSCEVWRSLLVGVQYHHSQSVPSGPTDATCYVYDSANNVSASIAQHYYAAPPGGSTISCVDDALLDYSTTASSTYRGVPLGDSAHDNVSAMNARISKLLGFPITNGTLLANAKAGFFATHWPYIAP